ANGGLLAVPALLDGLDAPASRAAGSADRLIVDVYEDRIGVRARENPQRHPTRMLDRNLKLNVLHRAVGVDFFRGHRVTVHYHFDGYLAAVADPGPLHVPVRLLRQLPVADLLIRLLPQQGGDLRGHGDLSRFFQIQPALLFAHRAVIDLEVDQMAQAVRYIGP